MNGGERSPEVLKTIEQALLSDTLLLQVVKANGLDKDPEFASPRKTVRPIWTPNWWDVSNRK